MVLGALGAIARPVAILAAALVVSMMAVDVGRVRATSLSEDLSVQGWITPTGAYTSSGDAVWTRRALGLTGTLPGPVIAQFTALTAIELDQNALTGVVPSELATLSALELVRLSRNELRGPLPVALGGLAKLRVFDAYSNQLTGPVPRSYSTVPNDGGAWTSMTVLRLHANRLSGDMPPTLASLADTLEILQLNSNDMRAQIPSVFYRPWPRVKLLYPAVQAVRHEWWQTGGPAAQLAVFSQNTAMTALYFQASALTGPVPSELAQCSQLAALSLAGNRMTGNLPAGFSALASLTFLDLQGNALVGNVDPAAMLPVSLKSLNLSFNKGLMMTPAQFANALTALTNMESWLVDGLAVGDGAGPLPVAALQASAWQSSLARIRLSRQGWSGPIPSGLGSLSAVTAFYLNGVGATGRLPSDICLNGRLEELIVSQNELEGNPFATALPACLSTLRALDLSANKFTGLIATSFYAAATSLTYLNMMDNRFSGSVATEVALLTSLRHLRVGGDALTGTLPAAALATMTALTRLHVAASPGLIGSMPAALRTMTWLKILEVDGTGIGGALDALYLEPLVQLVSVDLSNNAFEPGPLPLPVGYPGPENPLQFYSADNGRFTGPLPLSVTYHANLVSFSAGANALTGTLPSQFAALASTLRRFNVAANELSGSVPAAYGQLLLLTVFNVADNRLFGELPPFLGATMHLRVLNVSVNAFVGAIPASLVPFVTTADVMSFNRTSLCGDSAAVGASADMVKACSSTPLADGASSCDFPPACMGGAAAIDANIAAGAGGGFIFLLVMYCAFCRKRSVDPIQAEFKRRESVKKAQRKASLRESKKMRKSSVRQSTLEEGGGAGPAPRAGPRMGGGGGHGPDDEINHDRMPSHGSTAPMSDSSGKQNTLSRSAKASQKQSPRPPQANASISEHLPSVQPSGPAPMAPPPVAPGPLPGTGGGGLNAVFNSPVTVPVAIGPSAYVPEELLPAHQRKAIMEKRQAEHMKEQQLRKMKQEQELKAKLAKASPKERTLIRQKMKAQQAMQFAREQQKVVSQQEDFERFQRNQKYEMQRQQKQMEEQQFRMMQQQAMMQQQQQAIEMQRKMSMKQVEQQRKMSMKQAEQQRKMSVKQRKMSQKMARQQSVAGHRPNQNSVSRGKVAPGIAARHASMGRQQLQNQMGRSGSKGNLQMGPGGPMARSGSKGNIKMGPGGPMARSGSKGNIKMSPGGPVPKSPGINMQAMAAQQAQAMRNMSIAQRSQYSAMQAQQARTASFAPPNQGMYGGGGGGLRPGGPGAAWANAFANSQMGGSSRQMASPQAPPSPPPPDNGYGALPPGVMPPPEPPPDSDDEPEQSSYQL